MKILADPVAWMWFTLLGGTVGCFIRGCRRSAWWLLSIALAASIFAAADVPIRLLASLERPFVPPPTGQIAQADAVIVLGGFGGPSKLSYLGVEFRSAVNRLLTGIALIRNGKAPVLVIGGRGEGQPPQPVEAQAAKKFIQDWNLLATPIEFLGVSKNTHDEAIHAAHLAPQKGWKKIILVSSGIHLKRAVATFRMAGLEVVPIGCDFQGLAALQESRESQLLIIPSVYTLSDTRTWIEEILGYAYYRMRSWA